MIVEKKHLFLIFLFTLCIVNPSYGSCCFLRPFGWVLEPRLERPFLASIDVVAEYIRATKAFDKEKKQIPLMELFDISNNPETSHEGSFHGAALSCRLTQNFDKGFFISG